MDEGTDDTGELAALRARNTQLEAELAEADRRATARLAEAELRFEAMRAGMIDLDGLKLADAGELGLDPSGRVSGAVSVIERLRRDKPYLFGSGGSTSSASAAPPASAVRAKLATEMTLDEWRAARADLLRRR
jgi:hypothetical protein